MAASVLIAETVEPGREHGLCPLGEIRPEGARIAPDRSRVDPISHEFMGVPYEPSLDVVVVDLEVELEAKDAVTDSERLMGGEVCAGKGLSLRREIE